ncbi:MAG: hypothetical protein ABIG11_00550 [bacterium]
MCDKWEAVMSKVGCISLALGIVFMLLGIVAKFTYFGLLSSGPRSFAILAGLFYLLSIAIHTCPGCNKK